MVAFEKSFLRCDSIISVFCTLCGFVMCTDVTLSFWALQVKALVTVFGKDTPIVLDVEQVEVQAAALK